MILGIFLTMVVGAIWGITNPFIRKADVVLSVRFLLPFALNQCGSILYNIALAYLDISIVLPCANAFNVIFTAIAAHALGESMITQSEFDF